jgi:hypothetical protein
MSAVDKNAEIVLVNTTNNSGTINLPLTTTLPYRILTIKHIGSTSLNGITLATQGSDLFENGTTTYGIQQFTTFVSFYANASANRWLLVGGTNTFTQTISSLTVNTINGQNYVPVSPTNLVSTSLLTSSLVSTVTGLSNVAVTQIIAGTNITISPIGGQGIVTINSSGGSGGGSGDVTSTNLTSTTLGLGTLGYISSFPRFLSTNAFFTSSLVASTISTTNTLFATTLVARMGNLSSVYVSDLQVVKSYISSLQVDELILGTGDGWTDTGPLRATYISSIQVNTGDLYATAAYIGNTSTLNQIRFWGLRGNYNNTILAEVSTGSAVGAQEFLVFKGSSASDRIRMQTTGDIRFEPQVSAREFSTATALATPTMILQSNLVGIATVSPIATLDVRGTVFGTTISTQQQFISSVNGIGFISLSSAVTGVFPALFASSFVASTISTTNTIFTNALVARSTTTNAFFTSSLVASTISVTNTFFTNSLITSNATINFLAARSTNLSSVYISSLTAVNGYISSLTTDSLTIGDGNGFIDFGAARAVVFSSIQTNTGSLYATTVFLGGNSNLNQLRYWGLQGNYNNTILAEVSTGSAVGAQEFLVFKGSSTSDRIRFQTTGDIRFEPQVAAREFSTATALATPTMILQSNLVGINTISPATTLDVAGTVRAIGLSSQQLFVSSLNGQAFQTFVSTSVLNTSLVSTIIGLSNVAVTQIIAGSNVTISPVGGQGIVTINASGGGGGGITEGNLISTVEGLGTLNYISGPNIVASNIISDGDLGGFAIFGSTFKLLGFDNLADDFPVWNSSNQIAGSDPEPAPLRLDIFGSARILKNLYVGSTTTVLTTAGVQAEQLSSLHTTASTMTLSDKGPLFASTNTVTSITDVFLNDSYVAQRPPVLPVIISSLTTNMELHPEFLGMHFLLQNSDSNFVRLLVRADATFVANVPDGWYCYLKQFPDSNYFNDGVAAETDLGDVPLPDVGSGYGSSNYQAPMKFIVSGGFKIPY